MEPRRRQQSDSIVWPYANVVSILTTNSTSNRECHLDLRCEFIMGPHYIFDRKYMVILSQQCTVMMDVCSYECMIEM